MKSGEFNDGLVATCLQFQAGYCKGGCVTAAMLLCLILAGCQPSLKTVGRTDNQKKLARIALEAESGDVRKAAVERLANQTLLAEIVVDTAGWEDARELAVAKVEDQSLLARVALETNEVSFTISCAAARHLKDQALLAKVAVESFSLREGAGLSAVERLTNQVLLAKVATAANLWAVRQVAMQQLSDQVLLARIAVEEVDHNIREAACRSLFEIHRNGPCSPASADDANTRLYVSILQKIRASPIPEEHMCRWYLNLSEIARLLTLPCIAEETGSLEALRIDWEPLSVQYYHGFVQGEKVTISIKASKMPLHGTWSSTFPEGVSITKEKDWIWRSADFDVAVFYSEHFANLPQSKHVWIAIESKYPSLRRSAVKHVEDQSILAKIAVEDMDMAVRQAAVEKLEDQVLLAKVAMAWIWCESSPVSEIAVKKLKDQALLAQIAVVANDVNVCIAAVERIHDQKLLAKVAAEAKRVVREIAVEKLEDQALLAEVLQKGDNVGICERAVKKLKDQERLAKIAVEAENGYIRESAVSVMTNSTVLSKVAANDSIEWVRAAARKKLGELRAASQATTEGGVP